MVFCSIPYRSTPRGLTSCKFRELATHFNRHMAGIVRADSHFSFFWLHLRYKHIGDDGVHMNGDGNHRLFKSVRGAVISGLRALEISSCWYSYLLFVIHSSSNFINFILLVPAIFSKYQCVYTIRFYLLIQLQSILLNCINLTLLVPVIFSNYQCIYPIGFYLWIYLQITFLNCMNFILLVPVIFSKYQCAYTIGFYLWIQLQNTRLNCFIVCTEAHEAFFKWIVCSWPIDCLKLCYSGTARNWIPGSPAAILVALNELD